MVSLSFVGGMDVAHECLKSRLATLKNSSFPSMENESNLPEKVLRNLECWLSSNYDA